MNKLNRIIVSIFKHLHIFWEGHLQGQKVDRTQLKVISSGLPF